MAGYTQIDFFHSLEDSENKITERISLAVMTMKILVHNSLTC